MVARGQCAFLPSAELKTAQYFLSWANTKVLGACALFVVPLAFSESLYQERCIPAVLSRAAGEVHLLYDKPKLEVSRRMLSE